MKPILLLALTLSVGAAAAPDKAGPSTGTSWSGSAVDGARNPTDATGTTGADTTAGTPFSGSSIRTPNEESDTTAGTPQTGTGIRTPGEEAETTAREEVTRGEQEATRSRQERFGQNPAVDEGEEEEETTGARRTRRAE